ncbi:MAG: twin-arginine translocase TatA/TatE family subunit, partial [Polyangia bacterium]
MFGLGPTELIVILVLGLLVLGPERIPSVATSLGKAIRSFRRATRDLRDQIDIDDDVRRPLEDLRAALRDEPPPHPLFPPMTVEPPSESPVAAGGGALLDSAAIDAASQVGAGPGSASTEPPTAFAPAVASLVATPAGEDHAGPPPGA